jgi:hypothetical protein
MENKKYVLSKSVTMMKDVNKDLCEDYDDDGELEVEHYLIPEGLLEEYTTLLRGDT